MTTDTTGFQVAPVASEDDMRALQTLFQRVAASIVQASEYPAKVNELHTQVEAMRAEIESLRSHNSALDGTINELRGERDTWRSNAEALQHELSTARTDLDTANRTVTEQQTKIEALTRDLALTITDRDNYALHSMQLEDEVNAWKAKAAEARKKFEDLTALFKPEPEPVPEPQVEAPTTTEVQPMNEALLTPVKQAPPASPVTRDTWESDYTWDPVTQLYHRDH